MSAVSSYTVSRNPAYIASEYNTTADLIALTPDGYIMQIISNKGTAIALVVRGGSYSFGNPGRGESWNISQPFALADKSGWTNYGYTPVTIQDSGAIKWIYQHYPDTYHKWDASGIIPASERIPPMSIPQTPIAPPAPVVGDTPFMGTPPAGLPPVSGSLTAQGIITAPLTNDAQVQIAQQAAAKKIAVNQMQNQMPSDTTSGTATNLSTPAQTPDTGQTQDSSGLKLGAYTIKGYTLLIFGLGIIAVAYAVFKGLKSRGKKLLA